MTHNRSDFSEQGFRFCSLLHISSVRLFVYLSVPPGSLSGSFSLLSRIRDCQNFNYFKSFRPWGHLILKPFWYYSLIPICPFPNSFGTTTVTTMSLLGGDSHLSPSGPFLSRSAQPHPPSTTTNITSHHKLYILSDSPATTVSSALSRNRWSSAILNYNSLASADR